ncbi:pilus assembly PilX N-terminal domain-containing protein [Ammonifex thiophilus]|uniref:Type 4 fimbrial biogenesis protein PilX N-terminal domain-containing protein n=1 Tax=Ammonifex thiophilus TaxID=444093 RepID=A0A3D8P5G5_9THEO|nr:pilus assembly PilX N-terminal domain-containing protein [Ammonifex thiophilus]RDV83220.1 hypothetical protein DXX99_05750 [Ammonifex thiophilus]
MRGWRDERGQALALVLILSTVLFIAGTAAVAAALQQNRLVTLEEAREKAYYIAEAGVEKVLTQFRQSNKPYPLALPASGPYYQNTPFGGGKIEKVEVEIKKEKRDPNDPKSAEGIFAYITSTGVYPENPRPGQAQARRTVKAKVELLPDPFLSYGGPGVKSDRSVAMKGVITVTRGSFLARQGDISVSGGIQDFTGGIYAGGNVVLSAGLTAGSGEIKAGKDVDLTGLTRLGSLCTWKGDIYAGGKVKLPYWSSWLGLIDPQRIHENCQSIPGFPLPSFPKVGKGTVWYSQVEQEARSRGYYFNSALDWFKDPQKGIKWDYSVIEAPDPLTGGAVVTVWVNGAELDLTDPNHNSFLAVVNGPLDFNQAFKAAYDAWKQDVINSYQSKYKGKATVTFVEFLGQPLAVLQVKSSQPATIVADSITLDCGIFNLFGVKVDTHAVKNDFGLFAVNGDIKYTSDVALGGRLSALATGSFTFKCTGIDTTDLDWVAAGGPVTIEGIINVNYARASIPPATPMGGYRLDSWEVE